MIDAAFKALGQMGSPVFRRVLLKSVVLALIFLALIGFGLHRLLTWLAARGAVWAESAASGLPQATWEVLVWLVTIAAGFGLVVGALFLMPAVTAFVGTFFVDEIAEDVERAHYPGDAPGRALPLFRGVFEGVKTALFAILIYLVALPFIFFGGIGLVVLFVAAAYLLSREYFLLAAMRFRTPDEARALRRAHRGEIFFAGLPIAALVSIPIVNLVTPLFATAMMVHIHKRISSRAPAPNPSLLHPPLEGEGRRVSQRRDGVG